MPESDVVDLTDSRKEVKGDSKPVPEKNRSGSVASNASKTSKKVLSQGEVGANELSRTAVKEEKAEAKAIQNKAKRFNLASLIDGAKKMQFLMTLCWLP